MVIKNGEGEELAGGTEGRREAGREGGREYMLY